MVEKVGVLQSVPNKLTLSKELENGWDLLLVGSDAGKPIFGSGYQIHFKDSRDKLGDVNKELEKLGWSIRGYDSYLLTGVPCEVILRQLKRIFSEAKFFDAATKTEITVG